MMQSRTMKAALDNIKLRLKLIFSRARVTYVYSIEQGKFRLFQAAGLCLSDRIEHAETYGLASFPLPGAEAFVGAILGQQTHLVATTIADPRTRPAGDKPGEVILWSSHGQTIWLHEDGTMTVSAPNEITVSAPVVNINAPTVNMTGTNINLNADNVAITANTATLDCNNIAFGGDGALPVARVGDQVRITDSGSLGTIISGSSKMRIG